MYSNPANYFSSYCYYCLKFCQCAFTYGLDALCKGHSRPLAFSSEQHKILNSELKYLYTALTRARVNVWIYEEEEQTNPMCDYFKALNLVKVINSNAINEESK